LVRISDEAFAFLLIIPLIVFTSVLNVYPLLYSVWISFLKSTRPPLVFVGFDQYAKALQDPMFVNGIFVTLHFVADSIILSVLIGLGLALLMNRAFSGLGLVRAIFLLPWAISEYATGLIWKFMYNTDIGFLNAVLSYTGLFSERVTWVTAGLGVETLAVAFAWHMAPLVAFFLLAGLQFIPRDLYKAAQVDGARVLRRFRSVTLPFLRYPLLIAVFLVTGSAARTLDIVFTLTRGGPSFTTSTMTNVIYIRTFQELNFSYGAALSVYLIIIITCLCVGMLVFMTRPMRSV